MVQKKTSQCSNLSSLDQLVTDFKDLTARVSAKLQVKSLLESQGIRHLAEIARLQEQEDFLRKIEVVLQQVSAVVANDYIQSIQDLVTGGLNAVFDDMNLEFKVGVKPFRGLTGVWFTLLKDGIETPILEGTGGGVISVVSVLLRVVTIMMLGMERVLILDERLVHVSAQYVEGVSELLKKLCADLNFRILLVTHQREFVAHADHHYTVKPTKNGTTFEKVK